MRALALLLLACPLVVSAEDAASPPRWSLGAGLSSTVILLSGPGGGLAGYSQGPTFAASLERRLTESNWLVLGMDGSISDTREDSFDPALEGMHLTHRRFALDLGLRRVLTPSDAAMAVSILALADGGYGVDEQSGGTLNAQKNRSWFAGASVGVAVDRELTDGLSVRVATQLAGVQWYSTRVEVLDGAYDRRSFDAYVFVAPRLELRLAF